MAQGAIKAYPLKAQYHFHLAQLLLEQGDKEDARKEAQEAVRCELDPNVQKRYKAFAENIGG
jgi:Tfp pilus assembly protein FimV